MVFIPKHLKEWKPERAARRRCHWCTGEKMHVADMLQVLEAPMRFHFCSEHCLCTWQQHRHDDGVVEWLRECAGERHKILQQRKNA